MRKKHGFTLLEMLVVVGIIAILSAFLLPNLFSFRERARDARRKSDLKQIQKAMELYKQDQTNATYPASAPTPNACWSTIASCSGTVYMAKVPSDPSPNLGYSYFYVAGANNLTYTYYACLENASDPDGSGSCPGTLPFTCTSGNCYVVTQP